MLMIAVILRFRSDVSGATVARSGTVPAPTVTDGCFYSGAVAPFCDGGTLRFSGDDVATAQTGIFHHLVPQELSQSLSRADGSGLLLSVVLQLSGHRTILRNQLKQLRIGHVGSLENQRHVLNQLVVIKTGG